MAKKKEPAKEKKPKPEGYVFGRPTKYTLELAERICREVSTSTDGIDIICANNADFPSGKVVKEWRLDNLDFRAKYHTAKQLQADLLAEEIVKIADDSDRDVIVKQDRDGNDYEVFNTEFAARSKIRVDARKWIASKLLPKVYGDQAKMDMLEDKNKELSRELEELRAQLDQQHKKEF